MTCLDVQKNVIYSYRTIALKRSVYARFKWNNKQRKSALNDTLFRLLRPCLIPSRAALECQDAKKRLQANINIPGRLKSPRDYRAPDEPIAEITGKT